MSNFLSSLFSKNQTAVSSSVFKKYNVRMDSYQPPVIIQISQQAVQAVRHIAQENPSQEVGGFLVGPWPQKQVNGRFLVNVSDVIQANHAISQETEFTFTHESWRDIHAQLAKRYPQNQAGIVGWFHTHPGFNIFFSDMDCFLHQNFFTQIWHVAYVLDPIHSTSGFFCWNSEKNAIQQYDFQWAVW